MNKIKIKKKERNSGEFEGVAVRISSSAYSKKKKNPKTIGLNM
jgi:hypothetical protein